MKKIFSVKGTKLLTLILSIILIMMAIPINVFAFDYAEGQKVYARLGRQFVGADDSKVYHNPEDYVLIYKEDGTTYFRQDGHSNARAHMYLYTQNNIDEQWVYCIENGVEFGNGKRYTSENGNNSKFFMNLPNDIKYGICLALSVGWQPNKPLPIAGINQDDFFFATQVIIWEYEQGLRKSPTQIEDNGPIKANQFYKTIEGKSFETAYHWILQQMAQHATIPSFAASEQAEAPTYELKYDANAQQYSVTLTDENNLCIDFLNTSESNISITRNGNQYTFTTKEFIQEPICIEYKKNINSSDTPLLLWGSPGYQTMVTGASDPVKFYLNFKAESFGSILIKKTSEDGNISNIPFHISGNNMEQTVCTLNDGTIFIDNLSPGNYEITELTQDKYESIEKQTVTVVSGETTTINFNNVLKRGELSVTKTSEDGFIEGKVFHLFGISFSGFPVNEYAVTDENGIATFEDVLISGDTPYTLEEVGTEDKYVIPDPQQATVEWNKVTYKSFDNVLKKWRAILTKSDSETETAQGDASLEKAGYGVFRDGQLIDSYFTGLNGDFATEWYPCGDNWTIKEIEPSKGYLLNPEVYHVGADPKLYELEYNEVAIDANEDVIKGRIAILKHTDDGSTQIETPEKGAEFQMYLRSAGSYENAKESERDILICDEFGYAESKDVPYGWYRIHQTKGWDGREFIKDFDVYISEDGQVYRYLLNNKQFESRIKVVKKDAETGNTVSSSGHGYQLYDPQGNKITMTITYPEIVEIDTFYTAEDGTLITPENLPYGKGYSLVEVETVEPYVLDSTPVYFDITAENASEQDGVTVVIVEKENIPQKGTISLYKDGEIFSSVTTSGGGNSPLLYQPVYSKAGLGGSIYDVVATKDIISGGVLRYNAGETVTTLTTGPDGWAVSELLYLSTYQIFERKAPYGMTLNPEPVTVTLSYAGQHVEITFAEAHITNERQKVQIDLQKILEQDEGFGLGINGEIQNVAWGLYAAEQLTATDGSIIPADGLLEILYCDETGKATFKTDIPVDSKLYVKEYATDSHYVISNEKYTVEFSYQGQDISTVHISVNDGEPIENELIRGNIYGMKINEDGEEVAGAIFGLFAPDKTEFTEENALMTDESDEFGEFAFLGVPFGEWIIKELSCPPQFVLSGELFRVTVIEQAQRIEIKSINKWITGTVQVIKVDKNNPENKLSGAVFSIYLDVNGNKTYDHEIDTFVSNLIETQTGVYQLNELKYNGYFLFEEKSPEGFIADDKYYYFEINSNDIKEIENEAGVGFTNQPQSGVISHPETHNPKTGDNTNIWLWICLATGALTVIATCSVIGFKHHKKSN